MTKEITNWKPKAELPDSDTTALLFDPAESAPICLGYLDGDVWRYVDGMPATHAARADVPGEPKV